MPLELPQGAYVISDDPARIDLDAVHAFLATSYWAAGIPRETVERAVKNSLCLGAYAPDGAQVGFARVVSDYATFAWLADVYVLEAHRGCGLAKALMRAVVAHPRLQGLRRFQLGTRDAHGLYAQFGFKPPAHPDRLMEKHDPEVYKRPAVSGS